MLMARLWRMKHRIGDRLARTLRVETGAEESDPLPELVATLLVGVRDVIHDCVERGIDAGSSPEEARRRVDAYEALLSETVINYATRPVD